MAQARQGSSLAQIEQQVKGAKLSQPGFVGRNDSQLDPNVLGAAFDVALNKQGGEPKYRVVTTGNGQVALVGVLARRIDSGDSKQGARSASRSRSSKADTTPALNTARSIVICASARTSRSRAR